MSLPLYCDHNVTFGITAGCRALGLDVLTALADGIADCPDEEVLARATELGRIVFTQDTDFVRITGEWLACGIDFAGVVYGHQLRVAIGRAISDLHVIAEVMTEDEMRNQLIRLPI
jgi:hypothetical protein